MDTYDFEHLNKWANNNLTPEEAQEFVLFAVDLDAHDEKTLEYGWPTIEAIWRRDRTS